MRTRTTIGILAGVIILGGVIYALSFTSVSTEPDTSSVSASSTETQSSGNPTTPAIDLSQRYSDSTYGFSIRYPEDVTATTTFAASYLLPDAWSAMSDPTSAGSPIIRFVMPGSNNIMDAEVRIGASKATSQVANCKTPPSFATTVAENLSIGAVPFTTFAATDAAMNHFAEVHTYRTIHNDACIAVDLILTGTSPYVYTPTPQPPFTKDAAKAWLQAVLHTFTFVST